MGRFFAQQVGNNQQHRDKEQRAGDTRNQQGRGNAAFRRSNHHRCRNRRVQQRVMHRSGLGAGDRSSVMRCCHIGTVGLQSFANRNVLQGQQYSIKEDCKVILGGYSLAGLFALWAATQTNALYGTAAASPSVWFPGWLEYEAAHPIQTRRVYLSLGDREEHTKNQTMASVGDNIRALHSALTQRGKDCKLEWNAGGHFKDADLRTAKAFAWVMEGKQ